MRKIIEKGNDCWIFFCQSFQSLKNFFDFIMKNDKKTHCNTWKKYPLSPNFELLSKEIFIFHNLEKRNLFIKLSDLKKHSPHCCWPFTKKIAHKKSLVWGPPRKLEIIWQVWNKRCSFVRYRSQIMCDDN